MSLRSGHVTLLQVKAIPPSAPYRLSWPIKYGHITRDLNGTYASACEEVAMLLEYVVGSLMHIAKEERKVCATRYDLFL